jgi:hypothetical protein
MLSRVAGLLKEDRESVDASFASEAILLALLCRFG